ncbi:unnamed protein product, partial [Nesidiocoris tenuis]
MKKICGNIPTKHFVPKNRGFFQIRIKPYPNFLLKNIDFCRKQRGTQNAPICSYAVSIQIRLSTGENDADRHRKLCGGKAQSSANRLRNDNEVSLEDECSCTNKDIRKRSNPAGSSIQNRKFWIVDPKPSVSDRPIQNRRWSAATDVKELYDRYETMKRLASQDDIKLENIPDDVDCPELRALVTKHNKLSYRLGINTNPAEVAKAIVRKLKATRIIEKVATVGGFINIWLAQPFCQNLVMEIVTEGVKPPKLLKRQRVLVDFSSPNVAKQMHVGHLRTNFPTTSTSFHQSKTCKCFIKSRKLVSIRMKNSKNGRTIASLGSRATRKIILKEFQKIYDQLGISLVERGESFYQSRMESVVKFLRENDKFGHTCNKKIENPLKLHLLQGSRNNRNSYRLARAQFNLHGPAPLAKSGSAALCLRGDAPPTIFSVDAALCTLMSAQDDEATAMDPTPSTRWIQSARGGEAMTAVRDDRREVGLAVELSKLSGPRDRPPGASHDPTIKKQG